MTTGIQPITTPTVKAHSKRSPSGADWWGNCPGAPDYVESLGLEQESGPAAERGTMIHGISETALRFIVGHSTEKPVFPRDDPEAKQMVEDYCNLLLVGDRYNPPLCACDPRQWSYGVEYKVVSRYLPDSGGTIDCVTSCERCGWLRITDLKTGHGEVEALENQQCLIYGLQCLLDGLHRVRGGVTLEIIQPDSPSGRRIKRWTLTAMDLLEWLPVFQKRVAASLAPNAPLIAGAKQCKYCAASAVCPERQRMISEQAKLRMFGDVGPGLPLDRALKMIPELRQWCKNVESYAYRLANQGGKIPGFHLSQKRAGNRKWKSEEDAAETLDAARPGWKLFTDPKLKSPAQLEEYFDKEVIDELCTREPGGTVLVADEEDRRPAVEPQQKKNPFQHLLKPTT